jgi:hypothetical protein
MADSAHIRLRGSRSTRGRTQSLLSGETVPVPRPRVSGGDNEGGGLRVPGDCPGGEPRYWMTLALRPGALEHRQRCEIARGEVEGLTPLPASRSTEQSAGAGRHL